MSRDRLLARGRIAADAGMLDTCVIRRVTGTTTDDFSGVPTKTYLNPDPYTGKCRVQQTSPAATQYDVGQAAVRLQPLTIAVPIAVTGLEVNDEITITASLNDPDLVGRVFLVRELAHKSEATARRLGVEERTR